MMVWYKGLTILAIIATIAFGIFYKQGYRNSMIAFIEQINAQPPGRIEPLPEIELRPGDSPYVSKFSLTSF